MEKRIINKWRGYTVADCDCKYCLYYGGRKNREVNCLADECVCKAELQDCPSDSSFFLCWLLVLLLSCTLLSSPMSERKPFPGCASLVRLLSPQWDLSPITG